MRTGRSVTTLGSGCSKSRLHAVSDAIHRWRRSVAPAASSVYGLTVPSNKPMQDPTNAPPKPIIAIFSGPTSTIENSDPLITSNKARQKYDLPELTHPNGRTPRFDALRPQQLAAPVTVYVQQHSAHPLEQDAAELSGPPDGYLNSQGVFSTEATRDDGVPVYEIELLPDDGVYPLPFMGRRADGTPWDPGDAMGATKPGSYRQTFYPDASRVFRRDRPSRPRARRHRFNTVGTGGLRLLSRRAFGWIHQGTQRRSSLRRRNRRHRAGVPWRGLLPLHAADDQTRARRVPRLRTSRTWCNKQWRPCGTPARSGWKAALMSRRRRTGSTC